MHPAAASLLGFYAPPRVKLKPYIKFSMTCKTKARDLASNDRRIMVGARREESESTFEGGDASPLSTYRSIWFYMGTRVPYCDH